MEKAKNCITFYLISVIGYICLFITIFGGGYIILRSNQLDLQMHDAGMELFYYGILILIKYYIVHFSILLIFCIALVVEKIFNNKYQKDRVPMFLKKINKHILNIGIVLTLLPVYLAILIFILNDISLYRFNHYNY